jgi:hypothetical protein
MEKHIFCINQESLRIFGVDPQEGIDYLESKKAITIDPVHVTSLQVLKQNPLVAYSRTSAI